MSDLVQNSGQATSMRLDQGVACAVPMPLTQVIALLRAARQSLNLAPQVLRTLEVMLGCLSPKRNHHVVFASNQTLCDRAGGLSERSLRRHIVDLVKLGFVIRSDSANRKRYSCHDPIDGVTLRFGLDFSPLFAQLQNLALIAQTALARSRHLAVVRRKLRAACQRILAKDPDHPQAQSYARLARRNLPVETLETLLTQLPTIEFAQSSAEPVDEPKILSGTDGQNDRHFSNFNKENIENKQTTQLSDLLSHCQEAQSFAVTDIKNAEDVITHAQSLAPMIGITPAQIQNALNKHDELDVAALIYLIIEEKSKIQNPSGYFQKAAVSPKAKALNPWRWLRAQRLKAMQIVRGQ